MFSEASSAEPNNPPAVHAFLDAMLAIWLGKPELPLASDSPCLVYRYNIVVCSLRYEGPIVSPLLFYFMFSYILQAYAM